VTTNRLAAILDVSPAVARGFVQFLLAKGLIEPVDLERVPGARGKPATVYAFQPGAAERLRALLAPITGEPA
jgi:predicted ArsR family transcriptional regulator